MASTSCLNSLFILFLLEFYLMPCVIVTRNQTEDENVLRTNSTKRVVDDFGKLKTLFNELSDEISALKTRLDYEKFCMKSAHDDLTENIDAAKEIFETRVEKCSEENMTGESKSLMKSTYLSRILGFKTRTGGLITYINSLHKRYVPVNQRNFTIVNTINSTTSDDKGIPNIYDMVVLKQGNTDVIVVTDYKNKYVKSFWFDQVDDRALSSRLDMSKETNCAHKVAEVNENQIAVSCYLNSKIYIINVNPSLSLHSTINTKRQNLGIHAITANTRSGLRKRFLIGYKGGMSVFDMNGDIVKSLDIDITGKRYTVEPRFIKLTPTGNILVSDYTIGLICITQQRKLLWKYMMKKSRGVDCDDKGNVYLAMGSSTKVIVLSPDGKFIKDVLKSSDPYGLQYDSMKGLLYIADFSNGLIKIFKHQ